MSVRPNAPIIIKRKKVVGGDGHHGGAWKVAIMFPYSFDAFAPRYRYPPPMDGIMRLLTICDPVIRNRATPFGMRDQICGASAKRTLSGKRELVWI